MPSHDARAAAQLVCAACSDADAVQLFSAVPQFDRHAPRSTWFFAERALLVRSVAGVAPSVESGAGTFAFRESRLLVTT